MKKSLLMVLTGLGLMGLTAAGLGSIKSRQTLGAPGVRLSNLALHDASGNLCATQSVFLPETIGGMKSYLAPITKQELEQLPKDTTFARRIYTNAEGFFLQANVVLMGTDRTSIHRPEFCLTGQGWIIRKQEYATIHFDHPYLFDLPVQKFTMSGRGQTRDGQTLDYSGVYVFWFVTDGLVTGSHFQRVWWLARDLVLNKVLERWAYIAYFAPCLPGKEEETFERMKSMIVESVPEFETSFPAPPARGR